MPKVSGIPITPEVVFVYNDKAIVLMDRSYDVNLLFRLVTKNKVDTISKYLKLIDENSWRIRYLTETYQTILQEHMGCRWKEGLEAAWKDFHKAVMIFEHEEGIVKIICFEKSKTKFYSSAYFRIEVRNSRKQFCFCDKDYVLSKKYLDDVENIKDVTQIFLCF